MTVRIYLVRHGESEWNRDKRLTGHTDVHLTDEGREQALALKPLLAELRPDAVWSSDLVRASETGRLAWGGPMTLDDRLREFDFGETEGKRWSELPPDYQSMFVDFEAFQAPGGESGAGFYARIEAFLDELQSGSHLIFAHGGVVRAAMRRTASSEFVTNASLTEIDWTGAVMLRHVRNPRLGG